MRRIATGIAILFLLGTAGTIAVAGKPPRNDPREQTARAFFATGKYQEAIDIYSQLFAQYLHPMYIYNIGRCYQNMGVPDKALTSFREYLRKEKKLPDEMKSEIDGYIKEMEELKKQQQALTEKLGAIAGPAPAATAAMPTPGASKPTAPSVVAEAASAPAASTPTAAPAPTPLVAEAAPAPAAGKPTAPGGEPATPAKTEDKSPVAVYLAALHAHHDTVWQARAKKPDDAKADKIERLLHTVPPGDPRTAKYELFLADLYAGKHFFLRLKELQKDAQMQSATESQAVGAGARSSGPEITASFLKAAEHYAVASRNPAFDKADVVLMGLGVLLEANGMEARASVVLERLLKKYPASKAAREVLSGDVTKVEDAGTAPE